MSLGGINYTASKTFEAFHACDLFNRFVRGPVGSGKSSGMVFEMLARAMRQEPYEGVRKTRGLVVRNTYAELKATTIRTWLYWLGTMGEIVYDSPIRWHMKRDLADGTKVDFEVFFLPLDKEEDIKKLKSLEVTFCWINEFSEIPFSMLKVIRGRIGRFPTVAEGGATWKGLFADTNPYPIRSEWYNLLEVRRPKNHKLFVQPGGLLLNPDYVEGETDEDEKYIPNPDAENIENLPGATKINPKGGYEYYYRQIDDASEDYIKVFVLGEPGATYAGKAVFANTFSDTAHVASEVLEPMRAGGLVVGLDFGLHPAAVITQMSPVGQLMVLDELTPTEPITLEEFIVENLWPLLRTKYAGHSVACVGDPAGRGKNPVNKQTTFEMLKGYGLSSAPAYTNEFIPRRDAVAFFLTRRHGFIMSPACVTLREAMVGGYRYEKSTMKADTFKEKPEKTFHSHVADALQYACLYYHRQIVRPNRQVVKTARPAQPYHYV